MGIQEALMQTVVAMRAQNFKPEQIHKMVDRQILLTELEINGWNISQTAEAMGVRRETISSRVKRLGITCGRKRYRKGIRRADGVIHYRNRVVVQAGERFPTV